MTATAPKRLEAKGSQRALLDGTARSRRVRHRHPSGGRARVKRPSAPPEAPAPATTPANASLSCLPHRLAVSPDSPRRDPHQAEISSAVL